MNLHDELLDVAFSLFNQYGYRKVTVDDIAQKRGISKRTLYQHFESKEEIVKQVVDRRLHQLDDSIEIIAQDQSLTFSDTFGIPLNDAIALVREIFLFGVKMT